MEAFIQIFSVVYELFKSTLGGIIISAIFIISGTIVLSADTVRKIVKLFKKDVFKKVKSFNIDLINLLVSKKMLSEKHSFTNDQSLSKLKILLEEKKNFEQTEFLTQSILGIIKTFSFISRSEKIGDAFFTYLTCYYEEINQISAIKYDINKIFVVEFQKLLDELDYRNNFNEKVNILKENIEFLKSNDEEKYDFLQPDVFKKMSMNNIKYDQELLEKVASKTTYGILDDIHKLVIDHKENIGNKIEKIDKEIINISKGLVEENI